MPWQCIQTNQQKLRSHMAWWWQRTFITRRLTQHWRENLQKWLSLRLLRHYIGKLEPELGFPLSRVDSMIMVTQIPCPMSIYQFTLRWHKYENINQVSGTVSRFPPLVSQYCIMLSISSFPYCHVNLPSTITPSHLILCLWWLTRTHTNINIPTQSSSPSLPTTTQKAKLPPTAR